MKDNQPTLNQAIQAEFVPIETDDQIDQGHGRSREKKSQYLPSSRQLPRLASVKYHYSCRV